MHCVILSFILIVLEDPWQSSPAPNNIASVTFNFETAYFIIAACGIPGNLFTIFVLLSSSRIRSKPVNIFIIHQSTVDALVCIVTIAVTIYNDITVIPAGVGQLLFCSIMIPRNPMWAVIQCSGYNLMFLTLERYWAITKPLQYDQHKVMKRLPVLFAACWVIAVASVVPNSIFHRVVNGSCIPFYVIPGPWKIKVLGSYVIGISCVVPAGVMIWAYVAIGLSLHRSRSFQNSDSSTQSDKLKKIQMNLLQTCVILMVMFVLCWINHVIRYVLLLGGYFMHLRTTYYPSTALFIILNSCLNPFVYCVRYKEFQDQVKVLFRCETASMNDVSQATELTKH